MPPSPGASTGQPPVAPYGTPPPGYVSYGVPVAMPGNSRTNGMAVASLVLGIVGIVLCVFFVPWVLAIVFGVIGIRQCNADPSYTGRGMAIAGLVLGLVSAALIVLIFSVGQFDYQFN